MIILNKEEIKKCLPMKEAIEVCKESLKDYSENKTNIPLRINLPVENTMAKHYLCQEKLVQTKKKLV